MSTHDTSPVRHMENEQILKYFDVAPLALLAHEYILTFPREITLMWHSQWSLGKVLFFLNRYSPFIDAPLFMIYRFAPGISPNVCRHTYRVQGWVFMLGLFFSEFVLVLRTSALWNRDKRIDIGLGVGLVLLIVLGCVCVQIFLDTLRFFTSPSDMITGCLITGGNPILGAAFIAVMLFECVIVALTIIKAVQTFRTSSSTLLHTVYKDGILFFIYLSSLSLINVVLLVSKHDALGTVLSNLYRIMHSILSVRILLHLRQANTLPSSSASEITSTVVEWTMSGVDDLDQQIQSTQLRFTQSQSQSESHFMSFPHSTHTTSIGPHDIIEMNSTTERTMA